MEANLEPKTKHLNFKVNQYKNNKERKDVLMVVNIETLIGASESLK